jgi:hypothetical protein
MHFVPMLFAGVKTAAAGVGSAIASTGLTASGILSGAATVGGALATIGASRAQANSYKAQAAETEIEAVASDTQAVQKQTAMKRELMRVLGENSVTAAASGIDLGSGLAADTAYEAKSRAASELSIDRSTQDARRAMLRARASGLRSMAKSAKRQGAFAAFGQLANGAADIAERG